MQEITKTITTDKGETEFQVRLLQDEGVGLLTTKNKENYLILDSLDFWYELIQTEYPKKKKCSCKNEYFFVQFIYVLRQGTEDIREIKIITTCTSCKKIFKPLSIDINYSPTNQLIENPIVYCENPKLKYKYNQLTSYWAENNLTDFMEHLFKEMKFNVYCWYWQYPENKRYFEKVSFEKAKEIILSNHKYLRFYFSMDELNTSQNIQQSDSNGVYLDEKIWQKNEIVELSAPFVIMGYGLLYTIRFCNQYLDKGIITNKSSTFENLTNSLKCWMKKTYITKRGNNCFDGKEAYEKYKTNNE